jgi:polyisoprenoid-binding protein YceI
VLIFDAAQFPEIKFSATLYKINEGEYELVGDLTLHGVIKKMAEYGGLMKDPWGNTKMALALEGNQQKRLGLN